MKGLTINELLDSLKYHNHTYELTHLECLEIAYKEINDITDYVSENFIEIEQFEELESRYDALCEEYDDLVTKYEKLKKDRP